MPYNQTFSYSDLNLAAKFKTSKIIKSSLTISLIAGILSLPSSNKVAQARGSTPEIQNRTGDRSSLLSKTNLDPKSHSKAATFLPNIFHPVASVKTLIANLSSLPTSQNKYSTSASILDRINPKIGTTSIAPASDAIPVNQTIAVNPKSPATQLAAKPKSRVHVVGRGDTISKIAKRYGVSKDDLVRLNQIRNSNVIFVSQRLEIPLTKTILASGNRPQHTRGQSTPRVISSTPVKVANQERHKGISSSKLNSDRHSEAGEDPYIAKLRAEIEQLRNQKRQAPPATENSSASRHSKSSGDRSHLTVENATPQLKTVSLATSTPTSDSESRLLLKDSIALQLPPLPPEEYLPKAFEGYIWPAQGVLTSGYGWRWGRMHEGIDIAAPIGTPIVAAASGEVINAGWHSGYGNLIKLKHLDGSVTVYGHIHKILVSHGQKVDQGEQIAQMGNTGRSTGSHLHFEIRPANEVAVNPLVLLGKR